MIVFEIDQKIVNSRKRTKSFGYPLGYQGEGIKNLLFQKDHQSCESIKLRRTCSSCIPDFNNKVQINLSEQILSPRMAEKKMNPSVIIVSPDEISLNRARKIRKYRSMPQLIHGFSESSQDSLINKEERKRIKSVLLDIPDILQFDDSIALLENQLEPIPSPKSLHFSSQDDFQSESIENDPSTASDLMKDLSKSSSSYTEDIDEDNHAMLVVAQKKKITSSYVEGKTPKPRIVFNEEISKWKELGRSISDLPIEPQHGQNESEILESEKNKEDKDKLSLHFLEQSSMYSMAEETSDEMYERLKPSPELEQNAWTSSDHWKYFAMRRKLEYLQSCGDSQDSRVEMLMTPEPCDVFHGKESPSFPKRFSDDFSRRAVHSKKENRRGTSAVKGTLQGNKIQTNRSNLTNTDPDPPIIDGDCDSPSSSSEEELPCTDGWKRLPLTPKSSKCFTEVNPDNNLRDALEAWDSVQNGNRSPQKEEFSTESQTRRRSMTVGDVGIERQLHFDDLGEQRIKRKVSDVLVHLDKSFRLDNSLLDQNSMQSSISRGRQWLNKLLQHDFNRTASKTPTIHHNNTRPVPGLTAEILPSSSVRQSLMNYDLANEREDDDIVQLPIRITSKADEERKEYLQNQTKKEQRRKEELDKLRLSIAWDQISIEDPNEKEKKFEQNCKAKNLAGMFGQEEDPNSEKQASKMIRKTSSDKGALNPRFKSDVQQDELTTNLSKTLETRPKSRPKSQSVSKSTQKHSRKGSKSTLKLSNDPTLPPPLPKKPSMPKFEKGNNEFSYTPPVTSDLLPTSQKGDYRTINSLINESFSDEPRSIAGTSPEGEIIELNQEVSLDSFLIEVDHTFFHLSDAKKNFTRPNNFSLPLSQPFTPSAAPSLYPSINETDINMRRRKDDSDKQFKSSRRHSLSQIFKWKSNKVDERQTLPIKQPENITENTPSFPQKAATSSRKNHQRSKSHRMQLFARQKGDSFT